MVKSCTKFEKPTPGYHILSFGRVDKLAPPCARIPLALVTPGALRGTSSTLRPNSSQLIFAEELYEVLGAGGKPSTWLPPGGLVELS